MKGNKILAVIALIALTGFLWIACDSGGSSSGESEGTSVSDKLTDKGSGTPSLVGAPSTVVLAGNGKIPTFNIPYTAINCWEDRLLWEIQDANGQANVAVASFGGASSTETYVASGTRALSFVGPGTGTKADKTKVIVVRGFKDKADWYASTLSGTDAEKAAAKLAGVKVATIKIESYSDLTFNSLIINNVDKLANNTFYESDTIAILLAQGNPWANATVTVGYKTPAVDDAATINASYPLSACTFDTTFTLGQRFGAVGEKEITVKFGAYATPTTFKIKVTETDKVTKFTVTPDNKTFPVVQGIDTATAWGDTVVGREGLKFIATWKNPHLPVEVMTCSQFSTTSNRSGVAGQVIVWEDDGQDLTDTNKDGTAIDPDSEGYYICKFNYGGVYTNPAVATDYSKWVQLSVVVYTIEDNSFDVDPDAVSMLAATAPATFEAWLTAAKQNGGISVGVTITDGDSTGIDFNITPYLKATDFTQSGNSWKTTGAIYTINGLGGKGTVGSSTNKEIEFTFTT